MAVGAEKARGDERVRKLQVAGEAAKREFEGAIKALRGQHAEGSSGWLPSPPLRRQVLPQRIYY